MMKVSILHISDLHRSKDYPISNKILLHSLIKDRDRYVEIEQETKPDLIVVSGDMVQGMRGDSESEISELEQQYEEAYEFLAQLAEAFVEGDRNKVILIPGNHDVSWYHSKQSMVQIEFQGDEAEQLRRKRDLVRTFGNVNNRNRWSWNTFQFYKIEDQNMYNKRFELFSNFYNKFYSGARSYSLDPSEQYDILIINNITLQLLLLIAAIIMTIVIWLEVFILNALSKFLSN